MQAHAHVPGPDHPRLGEVEECLYWLASAVAGMTYVGFDGYHVTAFWRGELLRYGLEAFLYTVAFSWGGEEQ